MENKGTDTQTISHLLLCCDVFGICLWFVHWIWIKEIHPIYSTMYIVLLLSVANFKQSCTSMNRDYNINIAWAKTYKQTANNHVVSFYLKHVMIKNACSKQCGCVDLSPDTSINYIHKYH